MTATGAYIFPSQVYLDDDIRERCLRSREMRIMLDLASDTLSMDFRAILRDGDEAELNDPRFRRPLINLMGVAGYQQDLRERDLRPVCVTGISLGFLSAAAATGWVSLEDMVRMSHLMAAIEIDEFEGTGYVSVFFYNGDHRTVFDELRSRQLDHLLHLSAYVSSNQFLAACRVSDLDAMKPALIKAGAMYRAIPYSYPGHCDLMGTVRKRFGEEWRFKDPYHNTEIPLISINDARPYTSGETIRQLALEQYTTILDWRGVLRYLQDLELDCYVVLEPSAFVVKSIALDPDCAITPVTGGVGGVR
ncbi:ACP S-malonyltransferase [Nonomuraea candida]|uniref:ACP S-malonyltransferase n=1 Tax=Nonomuraea candida TaxID=359159 RepID=UPI0005B94313|nr:ACP S-malonyltransferase [Nonomuraea candida]